MINIYLQIISLCTLFQVTICDQKAVQEYLQRLVFQSDIRVWILFQLGLWVTISYTNSSIKKLFWMLCPAGQEVTGWIFASMKNLKQHCLKSISCRVSVWILISTEKVGIILSIRDQDWSHTRCTDLSLISREKFQNHHFAALTNSQHPSAFFWHPQQFQTLGFSKMDRLLLHLTQCVNNFVASCIRSSIEVNWSFDCDICNLWKNPPLQDSLCYLLQLPPARRSALDHASPSYPLA